MTDIVFKALSLSTTHKGATKPANTNIQAAGSKAYRKHTWNKPSPHAIKTRSSTSLTRASRYGLRSLSVFAIHIPVASCTRSDTLSSSLTLPSLAAAACEVSYIPSHSTLSCCLSPHNWLAALHAIREGIMKKEDDRDRHQRPPFPGLLLAKNRCCNYSGQQSSSLGRNTRVSQSAKNALALSKY